MSRLNTEFFIARRLSGRHQSDSKNVMVRIATITVAVSVAVMIIALAVVLGFKSTITEKLVGFGSHINIVNMDGNRSMETTPIARNLELEQKIDALKSAAHTQVYAVKGGIIKTDEAMQGVMLKGVGVDYDWSFFNKYLVEGGVPTVGDSIRTKDIIISRSLSRMIMQGVDDRIEMLFFRAEGPPRRDRFKIVGIYDSGIKEMDMMNILTDIRNVQRLSGWEQEQITGYEITTHNFDDLKQFQSDIHDITLNVAAPQDEILMVVSVDERFPNLFDWLKLLNVNAAVIITIMLIVALLNMISALLILLLERTRMIGTLKALGAVNWSLQKIFVVRSGYIVVKGLVWGNIIGIAICLVQKYTHLIKLDSAGYLISEIPINLGWDWLLWLNIGTFVTIMTLLVIPTRIVSHIKPDSTIRYR